jgi:hypothetical protein
MNILVLALACLAAETQPAVEVRNVEQAAQLPRDAESVRVALDTRHDHATLAAVLRQAPNVRSLHLYHPDHGLPKASIQLLASFPKLEELYLEGDFGLDDKMIAALGNLERLKSLRLRAPCASAGLSDFRLALLGGLASLQDLNMGNHPAVGGNALYREHERKVWKAISERRADTTASLASDHCKWVSQSFREIQTIKPGMTREDLLKMFQEEGGISNRTQRRYVYRGCPFIKVDVRFKSVGTPADKLTESPKDRILKLSKPFLEWSHID